MIEASWNSDLEEKSTGFSSEICIYAKNRSGMISDISKLFTEQGINLNSMNVRDSRKLEVASIYIGLDVKSREQLFKVMDKLRQIDGIVDIERTAG